MSLLVVAYPAFDDVAMHQIQHCRASNDPLYSVIAPHFTIVFAIADISDTEFTTEIRKQIAGVTAFSFTIGKAVTHRDDFSNNYYTFLVPTDGYDKVTDLHDLLYADNLKPHLRVDIAYIAHITIAKSPDRSAVEKVTTEWNARNTTIRGGIRAIDIINYDGKSITSIQKISLPG